MTMSNKTCEEECRACLKKVEKRLCRQLFEAWFTPWAVQGALIADDLAKFADIEISKSDEYSKVICIECYKRLTDACMFMITVQMNDGLLRARRSALNSTDEKISTHDTTWPQPILLNKNGSIDNGIQVEVKQEVLSEDENDVQNMDQDWEPTMDIKIEPEEITGTFPSDANGTIDETNEDSNINGSDSNYTREEYLDNTIKQEPMSEDDELSDEALDMPLECLLCFKSFHSVSGLKAHVIAQHSYGTVKRKSSGCPSPSENSTKTSDFTCDTCNQSFKTHTDLMLHTASHSEHVCYVCDAKFKTFQQLSRHGPRCRKKRTSAAKDNHTRPPLRPFQLSKHTKEDYSRPQEISQPIKNTTEENVTATTIISKMKPQSLPWKLQEVEIKCKSPPTESMEVNRAEAIDIEQTKAKSKIGIMKVENGQENLEIIKIKLIDTPPENKPSKLKVKSEEHINEKSKAESKPTEIEISSQIQDKLVQESHSILKEVNLESMQKEPTNTIAEENKMKKVNEQCHENLSKEVEDEPTEEILTHYKKYHDEHLAKDTITDLTQNPGRCVVDDINTFILNSEAITSENSSDQDEFTDSQAPSPETAENSNLLPEAGSIDYKENSEISLTNQNEILENVDNSNQNELSHIVELNLGIEEKNCSIPDSTSPLQQSHKEAEILTSTPPENLELIKSNSDKIIKVFGLEQTNECKDIINISNHQIKEQKELSMEEIRTPILLNEDKISEMKVHLAINPLDKDPVPFDTEIEDIACSKSDSCEPKLVNVISESSNTESS